MSVFFNAGDTVDDLYVCLVRNRTNLPFVTSDNPAVMTNRWHLTDRRARGVSPGLGNAGMIGLLPLAPDILPVSNCSTRPVGMNAVRPYAARCMRCRRTSATIGSALFIL